MKKQTLVRLLVAGMVMTLLLAAAAPAMGAPEKVRIFVEFAPGGKAAVHNALQQAGAAFHYTFDDLNSFVVTVPQQALNGLTKNPNVVAIEEDVPRYLVKSTQTAGSLALAADAVVEGAQTVPWGIDAVQARDVWDTDRDGEFDTGGPTGNNVTVCIIDTGYYNEHEDLMGVPVDGMAQLDPPYTLDGYGHGTHVAGTIAAQNNGLGVIGAAPGVNFYIVKFFGTDGLATNASDLIAASYDCVEYGAQIISMSLSGPRPSMKEQRAFDSHYAAGVLSIAAASNDGLPDYHYPASYDSVISVGALDESLAIADFSNFNDQVELAAPGVAVLSTLPYIDLSSLSVDGADYQANHIEYSGRGTASGALVDGGLCTDPGEWSGAVVLCQRGDISFFEKVINVQDGGGAAAVIYNNEPGNFYGTLGEGESSVIIGVSLSQEDGQYLAANKLGAEATVSSEYIWPANGYEAWDGTSMATPHVSAVAAVLWSANPAATNEEIREAMTATAFDLGDPGRDVYFGFGLVQAADALEYLGSGSGPGDALLVTVATDKTVYADREMVTITVTVTDGSAPKMNATVTATLTTPNGKVKTFTGLTDVNGQFSATYKTLIRKDGAGTYTINAVASLTGYKDGTGTTTFVVE